MLTEVDIQGRLRSNYALHLAPELEINFFHCLIGPDLSRGSNNQKHSKLSTDAIAIGLAL